MQSERRSILRKALHSTVSVFDRDTGEYVGLVADYAPEGIMITSSTHPIEVGETYHFTLLAHSLRDSGEQDRGDLDAKAVWCEHTSPSFYGTGFKVDALSPNLFKLLELCSQ